MIVFFVVLLLVAIGAIIYLIIDMRKKKTPKAPAAEYPEAYPAEYPEAYPADYSPEYPESYPMECSGENSIFNTPEPELSADEMPPEYQGISLFQYTSEKRVISCGRCGCENDPALFRCLLCGEKL